MSDVLSAEEAAHRCGVSSKTVRRWIESGRLKADKVGRSFRIDVSDLAPFIGHSEPRPVSTVDTGQDSPDRFGELVRLVRDQQQTIMELSGRCGYYQAEVEQLRATVLALQAPKVEPETMASGNSSPADQAEGMVTSEDRLVPIGTTDGLSPIGDSGERPAPPRPSWWRRWLLSE